MAERDLEDLRERIRQLDDELLAKAAERVELARRVGELKRRHDLPTIDYTQERVVLDHARATAQARGLDPRLAEDLLARLIGAAVSAQDEDSLRLTQAGAGQKAIVVGGAGRMGRWLTRFLSAQGYVVGSMDPAGPRELHEWASRALPTAELVMCAAPPGATAELYRQWAKQPPQGVVCDIASIKTPLLEPIRALRKAGGRVASIHPMFGPSVSLLRDADVVICDTGDADRASRARAARRPRPDHG